MNDYNKKDAEPVIRIVNWAEEKALLELTGHTRRNGLKGRDDNHLRTIYHTESDFDYESQTQFTHSENVYNSTVNGRAPTVQKNARLADVRSMTAEEQAAALYEQMVAEKEAATAADIKAAQFHGRFTLNKQKSLITGRETKDTITDPAITVYSANIGAPFTGSTFVKSTNPFGRDTSFSKPIEEYHSDVTRLE